MKPVFMLLITGWPTNSNKIILILFKTFIKPLEKILKGILVPDRKPQICPITALVKTNFIQTGNPRNTICMSVVKIFPRLVLEQITRFLFRTT